MSTPPVTEIVLPSGAFARIRALKGRDFLESQKMVASGVDQTFALIILACQIDDKFVTYDQVLDMDLRDVIALMSQISKYMSNPIG